MKSTILMLICISSAIFAGTPTIDGTFDGEVVWGAPIHTADGVTGWAGANAKKVYVTFDNDYIYFGAEVTASTWQAWCFIINTKSGGATTDSWSRDIGYTHTNKPDYDARGHFNGYAQWHSWNGSSWDNSGAGGLAATEYAENITGSDQAGWVEIRISKTTIPEFSGDVQFYITGDNNSHASFDACPNDVNTADWSGSHTDLSVYQGNVPFPVELTSFTAVAKGRGVELAWKTASEANNKGFEIHRKELNHRNIGSLNQSADESMNQWHVIGFVAGNGTTNAPKSYSFVDNSASGAVSYRLKQVDNDGSFEYSSAVEVTVAAPASYTLSQNHPNPFNPATTISYSLPAAGFVTLKVYDMLGKEVAMLVNGMQQSGVNKASFDASQLPSGIYFARLSSGGFNSVIKMTLMK